MLVGVGGRSVDWLVSLADKGEPGMVSNSNPAHTDWEKSSSEEARRSIGGRFLEEGESKASWDTEWILEVVVDAEEMDEVGERGRGTS